MVKSDLRFLPVRASLAELEGPEYVRAVREARDTR